MSKKTGFLQTSVGKKYLMAVTGLILIGFVIGHMIGNLQIFAGQDKLNAYAQFLQGLGPLLWVVRLVLLTTFVVHMITAIRIVIENRKARPVPYKVLKTNEASFASRTMKQTGIIILAFTVYHLLHFTIGTIDPSFSQLKENGRHDVYSMVIHGFSSPLVSLAYIASMFLLCLHLSHAFFSIFQTFGLNNPKFDCKLKIVSNILAFVIFIGNSSMPVAVLLKWITIPV
jgi:succinate dehydrogenase / fumarate reductase, cytochrome b subunit